MVLGMLSGENEYLVIYTICIPVGIRYESFPEPECVPEMEICPFSDRNLLPKTRRISNYKYSLSVLNSSGSNGC